MWAVAPLTLIRNSDGTWGTGEAEPGWWASTDGAKTWREITIREVDAIPAGWRTIAGARRVVAVDPATGDVVRLRAAPPSKLALVADTPPDAGIWVSGYAESDAQELVGEGSMVSVSRDGGRTWTSHTFSEPLEETGAIAQRIGRHRHRRRAHRLRRRAGRHRPADPPEHGRRRHVGAHRTRAPGSAPRR